MSIWAIYTNNCLFQLLFFLEGFALFTFFQAAVTKSLTEAGRSWRGIPWATILHHQGCRVYYHLNLATTSASRLGANLYLTARLHHTIHMPTISLGKWQVATLSIPFQFCSPLSLLAYPHKPTDPAIGTRHALFIYKKKRSTQLSSALVFQSTFLLGLSIQNRYVFPDIMFEANVVV